MVLVLGTVVLANGKIQLSGKKAQKEL